MEAIIQTPMPITAVHGDRMLTEERPIGVPRDA